MRACLVTLLAALVACGDQATTGVGSSVDTTSASTTTIAATVGATVGAGGEGGFGGTGAGGSGGSRGPSVNCDPPAGEIPELELELVAEGFVEPIGVEWAPGDSERFYVIEKRGLVRVVEEGAILPAPFLDLSQVVWNYGEAGLLGVAFHPDYAENGRLFAYYIQQNDPGGSHLVELARSLEDPRLADPAIVGGAPLLTIPHTTVHLGGALEFSPADGFLYLFSGERGNGPWAQDLSTWMGKVLRFDVATAPYSIPPGNLPTGLPENWDYGLRNPWRASFDACTGDLFIADVGDVQREELNIELAGMGNRNYGWPMMEGFECHPVDQPCDPTGLTLPAIDYGHVPDPDAFFVIVGGFVYRGNDLPALRGAYLHSNTSGRLFLVRHDAGTVTEAAELPLSYEGAPFSGIVVSMGQDPSGEVYLVQMDAGRIFRLRAARP